MNIKATTVAVLVAATFALAAAASFAGTANATVQATSPTVLQPPRPAILDPGDGTSCDLYDADCVTAGATNGPEVEYGVSQDDSTGYDLYGTAGSNCKWIGIRDYYTSYLFGTNSVVGVLQAYVCRRNGLVTRFDQVSLFAVQLFGWPWTMAYHLAWSSWGGDQPTGLPTSATSTTGGLTLWVCAWFKPICSQPRMPRYVIDATGSGVTCYVNGDRFDDCVGHRYR